MSAPTGEPSKTTSGTPTKAPTRPSATGGSSASPGYRRASGTTSGVGPWSSTTAHRDSSRGTCRPRTPAARPVSRWRAREPSAVGSSRRTAASRPSGEPASGSGAVTVGSFRRGVPGNPGPASGPSIPAPGYPVGTGSSWPGRAPSGGFREAPAHRREGGGPGLRPPARAPRARRRRPASRAGSGPDRRPVTASVPSCVRCAGRRWPGPDRSETRGTRCPFAGTGRTCVAPRGRIRWPVRRRRTRLRLPGGSARCTGQAAGGRGENRRASKSGGGRSCTVGGEPGRPMSAGKVGMARGPSRRSRSPGEGGDRSRRARGVRRTASSSWLLWSRITAWNASIGSLGERAPGGARGPGSSRRQGRSPDRAGQGVTPCLDQSGRHRRHRGLHRPAGGP